MPTLPRRWKLSELAKDATKARNIFRKDRVAEPRAHYEKFFKVFAGLFGLLIDRLPELQKNPIDPGILAALVSGKDRQKAFRYLAAPPISEDDLKTIADANLTPSRLKTDPIEALRVRDVVLSIVDPFRFPWIVEQRSPTARERQTAIIASAALAAAREVEKERRNTSKDAQEEAVKTLLRSVGMIEVAKRPIPMLTSAPQPGQFCGETTLAGTRADVVARLKDGRVLAIECKVSNSAVNSYKRIVHDTGGKAKTWYDQLGKAQVLPCAVLSGVFSPMNLQTVQDQKDVYLFWQHRLVDLSNFVGTFKKSGK